MKAREIRDLKHQNSRMAAEIVELEEQLGAKSKGESH